MGLIQAMNFAVRRLTKRQWWGGGTLGSHSRRTTPRKLRGGDRWSVTYGRQSLRGALTLAKWLIWSAVVKTIQSITFFDTGQIENNII
jgi:hypothetical protein